MKSNIYISGFGVSTNPEFEALKSKLPLVRGTIYTHQQIAAVIEVPHGSNRYHTVVNRWVRWAETDCNIVLQSERNVGYRAISESKKLDVVQERHKKHHRQYKRDMRILARADLDDQVQMSVRDHRLRLMGVVNDAMTKTTAGFKLTVVNGNPRRELPSSANVG